MFTEVDLNEAVRRAIQTEKNAMDFYVRGAAGMKNANARKVFELLAREEREHAHWFHDIYPGDDIPDLEAFLNSGPVVESDWLKDLEKVGVANLDERKAMELAMEKERKLATHLRELAGKIDNPEVKAVFEQNARSTDNHYQLIESEYARLMGMVHETDIDTFVRE
jgi:rubrerythrin